MRMPSMNMGAVRMLRNHAEYLMVRLEAVPEVAWILEAFRQMTTPYEAALKAHEDASRARRAAMARRDVENDRLDQETRMLAFTVLGRVNNNRNAPLFRHYFGSGFTELLRTSATDQRRRSIVLREHLESETDEYIKTRLEPFKARLEAFEIALNDYELALDMEARTRANLVAEKIKWLEGYRRVYADLRTHYHTDPREAENFFRDVRPSSSSTSEDEDVVDDSDDLLDEGDETDGDADLDGGSIEEPSLDEDVDSDLPILYSGPEGIAGTSTRTSVPKIAEGPTA